MRTSRFLVTTLLATTLLAAIAILPMAAQGPSDRPSPVPAAPTPAASGNDATNLQFRPTPGGFAFDFKPEAKTKLDGQSVLQLLSDRVKIASMMHNNTRCYTIQSYRFMRTEPASDAMKLKDSSTCQASTQFQAKSIVIQPGDTAAH